MTATAALVLVDIDGTLLDCGGQAAPIFASALEEVYGASMIPLVGSYDFAGKLDPQIVLDLTAIAGVERSVALEGLETVRSLYVERLAAGLRTESMRLLPAAVEFLQALSARPNTTMALLTGNWREGASTKLRPFDLERFFPSGAFGEDGWHRDELPPVAVHRARQSSGRSFAPSETWVVGDSRLDVQCARTHGMRSVGVATGRSTTSEMLRAAGADYTFGSLQEAMSELALFARS